jgi:lysozyme
MSQFATPTLSPTLVDSVKRFEGFTPRAKWDYKQYTNGYGTRARYAGDQIDEAEADRRLRAALAEARATVERHAPEAPEGVKNALTSLTFNAGADWATAGLGHALRRGDYQDARNRFLQYTRAGGEVLPGLVSRRQQEAGWWSQGGAEGRMGVGGPPNAFAQPASPTIMADGFGAGWRDQPPRAGGSQAVGVNAFRSPTWGADHYGQFVDWAGGSKGRSYV